MSSGLYPSMLYDQARGKIDFSHDLFRVMLVTDRYKPKSTHTRRSDVMPEVLGPGYERGGQLVLVTLEKIGGAVKITLGGAIWDNATISARGAVYFRDIGGELIAHIDFGKVVGAVNGKFELTESVIELATTPLSGT